MLVLPVSGELMLPEQATPKSVAESTAMQYLLHHMSLRLAECSAPSPQGPGWSGTLLVTVAEGTCTLGAHDCNEMLWSLSDSLFCAQLIGQNVSRGSSQPQGQGVEFYLAPGRQRAGNV